MTCLAFTSAPYRSRRTLPLIFLLWRGIQIFARQKKNSNPEVKTVLHNLQYGIHQPQGAALAYLRMQGEFVAGHACIAGDKTNGYGAVHREAAVVGMTDTPLFQTFTQNHSTIPRIVYATDGTLVTSEGYQLGQRFSDSGQLYSLSRLPGHKIMNDVIHPDGKRQGFGPGGFSYIDNVFRRPTG